MKKTIIFIPHYSESFNSLLPIALHVKNKKVGTPHFLIYFDDNSEQKKILKDHGIEFSIYKIRSFLKIPVISRIAKVIWDLIYSHRLVKRLALVQALVCTVETTNIEYALISVLNRKRIKTIVLQWSQTPPKEYFQSIHKRKNGKGAVSRAHGRISRILERFIDKIFKVKHAKFYGDGDAKYFAVMSNFYKKMFYEQGVLGDKLVVTGHPEQDYLYRLVEDIKNPRFKHSILEAFGLDNTKPLWIIARGAIAYYGLADEEKDKYELRCVCRIVSEYYPNAQIVLKLHPRDYGEYYEFVKREFPHITIIHKCNLYYMIAASELYITQISSTMMWAIALDKPVISYDFNNRPYWHLFRDREGVIKVDTPEQLDEKIKLISEKGLSPGDHRKHQIAKQKYMVLDGKSCERIIELVMRGRS